ncbi:hypothetical protein CDL12_29055 [Handroanthus impetiginosus]|uniref:Uncharacterized protein n=1 Tax=Handroanthus impetiginosus TaxID=429701 RepID=A0A2G9FZH3_9LAMI|nr:hypothetical protein CDL12_29055 [Handroanthus impetiginosus]
MCGQSASSHNLPRGPNNDTQADEVMPLESENNPESENNAAARASSDDITSQNRRRGPNQGAQVPNHPDQRTKVTVIDDRGTAKMARPRWHKVPKAVKDLLWENFKLRYWWDNLTDMQMRKVWNENASARFRESIYKAKQKALENAENELLRKPHTLDMIGRGPDWMSGHIWDELVEKYWSSPQYKRKSAAARKSRMTEKDGSITKHTGGSIPQAVHRLRMEKDLGRNVDELEVFHRTHRKNQGVGEFGHLYGVSGQCSERVSGSSVTSRFAESDEKINELSKELEDMRAANLKMQEEFLRTQNENKRMLEQALEENRKREEEARKREEGLQEMVCKLLPEVGYTNRQYAGGSGPREQHDFGSKK